MKRARKPKPAVATSEDFRRWRKLATVAARVAAVPLEPAGDLGLARTRVKGRGMPAGQAVRGSVFDRLARLADRWNGLPLTDRLVHAEELAALATACLNGLTLPVTLEDPQPPMTPGRRLRADIDG